MRRRVIIIVVALVVTLAIGGGIAYATLTSTPTSLSQATWTLTRMVVNGREQTLSSSHSATLRFLNGQGQVAGSGGCNTFGGSYTIFGSQIRLSELRSTLIACANDEAMAQESQYFQALSLVTSYQLTSDTLTLTGDSGNVTLTFRAS